MNFKVFFSCHSTSNRVDSQNPIVHDKSICIDLALQMLQDDGDFYGLIDDNNRAIQFIVNPDSSISMDIPIPEKQGSFTKIVSKEEVVDTLDSIKNPMDIHSIKGLEFKSWGGLEEKWLFGISEQLLNTMLL